MESFKKFINDPKIVQVLIAVVIVLLVIVVFSVFKPTVERLAGQSYSAGATMRVVNSELSATDQRPYETGYNMQITEVLPTPSTPPAAIELAKRLEHQTNKYLAQEEVLASKLYSESLIGGPSPDDVVSSELAQARQV